MARLNVMKLLGSKNELSRMKSDHPQIVSFGKAIWPDSIACGTTISIKVVDPSGGEHETKLELNQADMDFIHNVIK